MIRIGITGGIGSGKSFVARLLSQRFGIPVYDCDSHARMLMTTSSIIRDQLKTIVGVDVYLPDGTLNKPLLANYLFASRNHAVSINAIVHPVVKDDFLRWADEEEAKFYFAGRQQLVALESAILLDAGFDDIVDRVLLVDAPQSLRLQRVMRRDSVTEEQVRKRMQQQMSDEERRQRAHAIIINDGRPLEPQLQTFIHSITEEPIN